MSISYIHNWLVWNDLHCGIKINGERIRISLSKFLYEIQDTLTNVVLPVPDIPIAMRQIFLLLLILLI